MKIKTGLISSALLAGATLSQSKASTILFTNSKPAWDAWVQYQTLNISFEEGFWPHHVELHGPQTLNGVTVLSTSAAPIAPNIVIGNYLGLDNVCVSDGDENFDITVQDPRRAFALDAYANIHGPATVSAFDADNHLLGSATIPAGTMQFVGMVSDQRIARVHFDAVLGRLLDTGIDNIRTADLSNHNPADLNDDCVVDSGDLGFMLLDFGSSGASDLDGSGEVDGGDVGLLLLEYGWTCL
ncbi:MAG: hypothetical protein K8R92_08510 [Planctomycetes bacterium]|nr:hypothetical protein [Planctomycetota bacterium]